LFLPRDADEHIRSAASTLGWGKFTTLAVILVLIYCLVFFSLEAFSFFNWLHWLGCVVGSAALTILLILTMETLRR
jgi:protein-S-isoprenylcysteine O-methyltransferase Ste14